VHAREEVSLPGVGGILGRHRFAEIEGATVDGEGLTPLLPHRQQAPQFIVRHEQQVTRSRVVAVGIHACAGEVDRFMSPTQRAVKLAYLRQDVAHPLVDDGLDEPKPAIARLDGHRRLDQRYRLPETLQRVAAAPALELSVAQRHQRHGQWLAEYLK
jgi:hypothetical protein